MMKIGTAIVWHGSTNNNIPCIRGGTITKVGRETYWIDNQHKAEDQIYAAYCFPDTPEVRTHLQSLIDHREEEKAWNNDYMGKTYELRNKFIREGKL